MNARVDFVEDKDFVDLRPHRKEVLRLIRNHNYERDVDGSVVLPMGIRIGGSWVTQVYVFLQMLHGPKEVTPNILPNEGLDDLLAVWLGNGTQSAIWHIAPFSGNVTPNSTYTAANFDSNATEFINYTESARVVWADDAVLAQSISNAAVKADFTMDTGGGTIFGAGLLSISAKQAVTGKLAAATRFGTSRVLSVNDILTVQYTLSSAST